MVYAKGLTVFGGGFCEHVVRTISEGPFISVSHSGVCRVGVMEQG